MDDLSTDQRDANDQTWTDENVDKQSLNYDLLLLKTRLLIKGKTELLVPRTTNVIPRQCYRN